MKDIYATNIGQVVATKDAQDSPTVEENIDRKIRYYQSEINRLQKSKEDLGPLLKMRIGDIRQAMEY